MLFYPLKSRLAFRLLVMLKVSSLTEGSSVFLKTDLTQSDFANMVGGSRQQVNKIFRQWRDKGIVHLVDGRYQVPSVNKLVAEADQLNHSCQAIFKSSCQAGSCCWPTSNFLRDEF